MKHPRKSPHQHVPREYRSRPHRLAWIPFVALTLFLNADSVNLRSFKLVIADDGKAIESGIMLAPKSDYAAAYSNSKEKNMTPVISPDGKQVTLLSNAHPEANPDSNKKEKHSDLSNHVHTDGDGCCIIKSPKNGSVIPESYFQKAPIAGASPAPSGTPASQNPSDTGTPSSEVTPAPPSSVATGAAPATGSGDSAQSASTQPNESSSSQTGESGASGTSSSGSTPSKSAPQVDVGLKSIPQPEKSSPLNNDVGKMLTETARATSKIEQNFLAADLLQRSRKILQENISNRENDRRVLESSAVQFLSKQDPAKLPSVFAEAETRLMDTAKKLRQVKPNVQNGMDSGDLVPQITAYDNAIEKVRQTKAFVIDALKNPAVALTNLEKFLGFQKPKGTGGKPVMEAEAARSIASTLFENGGVDAKGNLLPPTNNASEQVNKIAGLNLLPPEEQKLIISKLKLAEKKTVTLNTGESISMLLLHAGYILGGGKSAVDCSSFVSMVMPNNFSNARLTTLDLLAIWKYRTDGFFPKPPIYDPVRAKFVESLARAFIPINPYFEDATLLPGDLLLYRIPGVAIGHVLVVESYDQRRWVAQVIEAAQSAGTIRRRDYFLSQHPKKRVIRPGLLVLRMKPYDNSSCRYPAGKKRPIGEQGGAQ